MQQHREARRAFDQRADRRVAKAQDEVSFPSALVQGGRPLIGALAAHAPVGSLSAADFAGDAASLSP